MYAQFLIYRGSYNMFCLVKWMTTKERCLCNSDSCWFQSHLATLHVQVYTTSRPNQPFEFTIYWN